MLRPNVKFTELFVYVPILVSTQVAWLCQCGLLTGSFVFPMCHNGSLVFNNGCDPAKLHCDPLGFQGPRLRARCDLQHFEV